jgi:hypothetical protein
MSGHGKHLGGICEANVFHIRGTNALGRFEKNRPSPV